MDGEKSSQINTFPLIIPCDNWSHLQFLTNLCIEVKCLAGIRAQILICSLPCNLWSGPHPEVYLQLNSWGCGTCFELGQ